jgi:hypothetical protein
MENKHTDYFLRRIIRTDANHSFITSEEEFNTPSKTLKEFVREDKECYEDGLFITYIFGKENKILGISRMKPMSFEDFKAEVQNRNSFELEEIEEFADIQVIYMSRAGVLKEVDGLGFGTMLRSFLDGHARYIYTHFLLFAYINEKMYKSLIKRFGQEFFTLYKVSKKLFDQKWKWYWVILREFKSP